MKRLFHRTLISLTLCALLASALVLPASAASFEDVPDGHWAAGSIHRCVEQGFFNGESATRFGVGHEMTRSAFTVVLCRFFGWETSTPAETVYPDVASDVWYAGAIQAAYEHGAITNQRETFRPADPLTREELAVMLVRALGYGSISGLSQNLPNPFTDVTTNAGYISMAYHLGLVSGTSADTFSPNRAATREQVAVILMRLYDKLQAADPRRVSIVSTPEDVEGVSAVAIPAAQLVSSKIVSTMLPEETAPILEAAHQADIPALLYVPGSKLALNDVNQTHKNVMDAVTAGGYDGIFLDFSKLTYRNVKSMNSLVNKLNTSLGDKLLYLTADAPTPNSKGTPAYDYATLSRLADQLFLKIEPMQDPVGTFMVAPPAPPESIYFALASLQSSTESGKLALMFSATHSTWLKTREFPMTAEELSALLEGEETKINTSERYACSYFSGPVAKKQVVTGWYLEEDTLNVRLQLASLLGTNCVCLTN